MRQIENLKTSELSFWDVVEIEVTCMGSIEKGIRNALDLWTGGLVAAWSSEKVEKEVSKLKTQYERSLV